MLRGNAGQDIFFSDDDRYYLYLLIQQGVERYRHRILAFCLMNNHIHLAIQVSKDPLSKIIQNISFRYTRWINKGRHRIGHLFQGRYKAVLVDADSYLLELVRYIHLNPVRAGLVKEIGEYKWSSHKAYLGEEEISWLHSEWVLSQFAERLNTSRRRYFSFVSAGREEGHRTEFHGGGEDARILGDDGYLNKITGGKEDKNQAPELKKIIDYICEQYGVTEAELIDRGRNQRYSEVRGIIGWLAVNLNAAKIKEVAKYFDRDATTLSRRISGVAANIRQSRKFKRKVTSYKNTIMQA